MFNQKINKKKKAFDKTGILNISDDYDIEQQGQQQQQNEEEESSEIFGDDLSEYAVARMRRERKLTKSKTNKTAFNQTTSTEIPEFGNTPLSCEKRSRSLISVRRRRWSASSNRSASGGGVSAHNSQQRDKSRSRTK